MSDYYVYVHYKKSCGTPFYVGKGKGARCTSKHGRNPFWKKVVEKHGVVVKVVQSGIQEWYAFELEKELIALYGLRQDGSGTLVNMTDGGEGISGHVMSSETKSKISKASKQAAESVSWRNTKSELFKKNWQSPLFREAHKKAVAKAHNIPIVRGDGKSYESVIQAAIENNTDPSHICKVLKGKRNKTAGFTWSYLTEEQHGI